MRLTPTYVQHVKGTLSIRNFYSSSCGYHRVVDFKKTKCPSQTLTFFEMGDFANTMLEKASIENGAETRAIKAFAD